MAAERNVPSFYAWLEVQVDEAVRANNLTQAGLPLVLRIQHATGDKHATCMPLAGGRHLRCAVESSGSID